MSEEAKEHMVSMTITDLADLVIDAQNLGYGLGVVDSMKLIVSSLTRTSPELLEKWEKTSKERMDLFIKKVTEEVNSDNKQSLH
jgi:phage terminase large subunit